MSPPKRPEAPLAPGPHAWPVVGSLPALWGRHRIFGPQELVAKYGDIVRFRVGRGVTHFIQHPDHVRHVVHENHSNYERGGRTGRLMRRFLGEGLITTEGDVWKRQRRLTQPPFHPKRVQGLVSDMVAATDRMLDDWGRKADAGTTVDISEEMLRLSLAIAGSTLFGQDLSGEANEIGRALQVAQEDLERRLRGVLHVPESWPTPRNREFAAAVRTLDRIVYGVIKERRQSASEKNDLLAMLMDARDENNAGFSDRELRDQVLTLIAAGYETTAHALAWAFILLSERPAHSKNVADEARSVLEGRPPDASDLRSLTGTRRVVDETLRLYPTVWVFARHAKGDDVVGGYHIPAGSIVAMSPYFTHRHPAFWRNPEGFDPERFTEEAIAARPKHAYVPFGGGPHVCIGNSFALSEMTIVLAMALRRFSLSRISGPPVVPEALVSLRPRGGIRFTIHRR